MIFASRNVSRRFGISFNMALGAPSWEYLGRFFCAQRAQAMRAQCGRYRYPFSLLGNVTAVQISVCRPVCTGRQCVLSAAVIVTRSLCSVTLLRKSNFSLSGRCGEAALPPPLGEVAELCEAGEGSIPSQSKIKDFCQLSHRESRGCFPINSNLTVTETNREGPMVCRRLPAFQARIARRGIPENSNL